MSTEQALDALRGWHDRSDGRAFNPDETEFWRRGWILRNGELEKCDQGATARRFPHRKECGLMKL